MNGFKIRLIEERAQLAERVEKLEAFLQSDKSNVIYHAQLALLKIQLTVMKTYLKILIERLNQLKL